MRYYKFNIKPARCTNKMPVIYTQFEHFLRCVCTDLGYVYVVLKIYFCTTGWFRTGRLAEEAAAKSACEEMRIDINGRKMESIPVIGKSLHGLQT